MVPVRYSFWHVCMRLQQHMLSRNTVHILCLRHVVALKQLAPYIQRSSLNRLSQYHFSIPIFHFYVGNFSPIRSGKMNVACLLILLGVSPQLQCSLLTRLQLELSASFRFLVESKRCLLNCHCTRYGTRFMHHVIVRHGNTNPVSPMWSLWIFF